MRWVSWLLGMAIGLAAPAHAGNATQTDWSGGGGELGPVTDLGDRFDTATDISWCSIAGQIALAAETLPIGDEHLINDAYYNSFGIVAEDMDGDGDTDVVGTAETSGVVSVWFNAGGDPVSWNEQVIDDQYPGADGLCAADLDGDGHPDVIATAGSPGQRLAWWRNDGSAPINWTRQIIDTAWVNSFEVSAADVDGDEQIDVVSASYGPGSIAWWHNGGGDPILWTKHFVDETFDGAHSAYAADLDGDGDADIIGTAAILNEVAWWRNDGGDPIDWTKDVIRTAYVGGRSVYPADIDGDGDIDIAGTAWTNEVTWWRNDGGDPVSWHEQVIHAGFDGGHSVWVADVDGNGFRDVLAAACNGGDITWYENDGGDPILWTRHFVDGHYSTPITVRTGDIDGDGALDVLGTSYTLGTFTWWEATQFLASGELTSSILDTQAHPVLSGIDWTATQLPGTDLRMQLRSSDDPANMGDWSADITSPGSLSGPRGRYVQIRILLGTTDPESSPILTNLELIWPTASAPPDPDSAPELTLRVFNPAARGATIQLVTPAAGEVELTLFDLNGRQATTVARGRFAAGRHELQVKDLSPGIYLCRLRTGEQVICQRLVVVGS